MMVGPDRYEFGFNLCRFYFCTVRKILEQSCPTMPEGRPFPLDHLVHFDRLNASGQALPSLRDQIYLEVHHAIT